MVAVGDVPLVCDTFDDTESSLQALCELICSTFNRSSVWRECDIGLLLPLCTHVIHMLHDIEGKACCTRISVALTCHVADTLAKAGVSKGNCRVTTVKELVDRFTLL